jgi:sulfite reductase beta subunit-like hemoprotein
MPAILNLPASFDQDLEQFRRETDRFRQGAVSAAEYRSFRVPRGVYELREADTYMLRSRCPAGAVQPHPLRALAAVSRRYGNGVLHVTTRQDIQVHRVLRLRARLRRRHRQRSGVHCQGPRRNVGVCGVCRRRNGRRQPRRTVVRGVRARRPDSLGGC